MEGNRQPINIPTQPYPYRQNKIGKEGSGPGICPTLITSRVVMHLNDVNDSRLSGISGK